MINYDNLEKIKNIALSASRVLDLGGGRHALPYATHVVDLQPFTSDLILDPITREKKRFTEDTWIVHDICSGPLPFEDNFFDFCFCSHLLEDIRDPIFACSEIIRVSKAGYIETPSRQREIFAKARLFKLKTLMGKMPEVGFYHHRWFVEDDDGCLVFTAKDGRIYQDNGRLITRSQLGRKMTPQESSMCFFWEDSFEYRERHIEDSHELNLFRDNALKKLR